MKRLQWFARYSWILLVVMFAVILLIQIVLKLLGRSPTDTQIIYIALGAIFSYLLVMSYNLGKFVGEVKEFMKITKSSFSKINAEMAGKRV